MPKFWYDSTGVTAALLGPISVIYSWAGRLRWARAKPANIDIPVICVGSLVIGGAGKTPTALSIACRLKILGKSPHFLSFGYGGSLTGPVQVDLSCHDAKAVGDEPLLLATQAPTWVARDRAAGAYAAAAAGAEMIILDDGFQNPYLTKDLALIVIDGTLGFGNGKLVPAGPLRENVNHGLSRADAAIIIGEDRYGISDRCGQLGLTLLKASLEPEPALFQGADVVAFAGIAHPSKFFTTLDRLGIRVIARYRFANHHFYTMAEIMQLVNKAKVMGALLVTTSKDHIRLPEQIRGLVRVLTVQLVWEDGAALDTVLEKIRKKN
jgi:tetraacyldisaccharide 4'-kinase